MENNSANQQTPTQEVTTEKKERIDELDIVGGALVKLVISGFTKIKNLFSSKSTQ